MKSTSVAVLYQNWRLMSTEYQTGSLLPPVARSRVPWIFGPTADGAIFANFMDKRSLCATNGDMSHAASLVYSRDGWLLFLSLPGEKKRDCQMVLMNPFSGETFTMPPAPLGLRCGRPKASFTYWSSYSVYLRGPYLVEFEGRVLSVCAPKPFEPDGGGKFFVGELTVGENRAALVELDDSELSNKSWFLGPVQSFRARIKGHRVYNFAYKPQWDGEDIEKNHHYHVHYHDLLKKKFRYLTVDEFSSGHSWVDLGGVLVTRYPKTQA
uniref:DUF295 domain-containing protein n=2 Tax=Oryza TaxID=4527 RepID=A0A0E0BRR8_9ORYZ